MKLAALILLAASTCASQETPDQLYQQATAAFDRGEIAQAISLYEQLLKLRPDLLTARIDFGVALVHEGRYSEAIAQYEEVLRRDPGNAATRLDLALAWHKQGEFTRAASDNRGQRRPDSASIDSKSSVRESLGC
jgi:tetratricopeptide (TPR) repeat protein